MVAGNELDIFEPILAIGPRVIFRVDMRHVAKVILIRRRIAAIKLEAIDALAVNDMLEVIDFGLGWRMPIQAHF